MMNLVQDSREKWLKNIPAEWSVIRVKNIFKLSKEKNKGEIIDVLSLTQQGIKVRDITDNDGQIAESYDSYTRVRPGDIVFNPMDLRSGSVDLSKFDGVISLAYTIIRKKPNVNINLKYYSYYFYWHYLQQILFPYGKGVSTDHRWTLQDDILMNFPVLCPKKEDQNTMSELLDKKTVLIDQIIEKKQKLIGLLQEKRSALITHAVTKGLDPKVKMKPSGIFWLGNIPEKWGIRKISHIFSTIGSGSTPASENPSFYDGDINWVQSGDINGSLIVTTEKKITNVAMKSNPTLKLYHPGSIIVAMYGASVGNISLLNIDATTNQACCILEKSNLMEPKFAFYSLLSTKDTLIKMGQGGTQPNINREIIKKHKIGVPDKNEQLEIIDYLDKAIKKTDLIVDKNIHQIELLREYRSSLIYHAVTGKIKI